MSRRDTRHSTIDNRSLQYIVLQERQSGEQRLRRMTLPYLRTTSAVECDMSDGSAGRSSIGGAYQPMTDERVADAKNIDKIYANGAVV